MHGSLDDPVIVMLSVPAVYVYSVPGIVLDGKVPLPVHLFSVQGLDHERTLVPDAVVHCGVPVYPGLQIQIWLYVLCLSLPVPSHATKTQVDDCHVAVVGLAVLNVELAPDAADEEQAAVPVTATPLEEALA